MAQLLPDGLQDPVAGDPVLPDEQSVTYGESWAFHLGSRCGCHKPYPHLEVYGNKVQRTSGVDTLTQWIRLALITERFKFPIYTDDYGVEFEALVSSSPTAEEVETEAPRMIRDALEQDDRVVDVRTVRLVASEDDPSSYFVDMEVVTFTGVLEDIELTVHLEV